MKMIVKVKCMGTPSKFFILENIKNKQKYFVYEDLDENLVGKLCLIDISKECIMVINNEIYASLVLNSIRKLSYAEYKYIKKRIGEMNKVWNK